MAEGSSLAGSLHAANDSPAGDDGGSNEAGNSEVVSLMDRLRAPTKSDLTRKRKIATNPPKGKRTCRGGATTDPKGVTPAQRLKELPGEALSASLERTAFCSACREELSLKSSSLKKHMQSDKHEAA